MAREDENEERFNPRRRLCPDGSCIGVIGADGKCTVCGSADASGPGPALAEEPALEGEDREAEDLPADDAGAASNDGDEPGPAFDPKRRLCGDDACIGVIGSNNCCSVCGRPDKG